jgi:rare lipoprotein A
MQQTRGILGFKIKRITGPFLFLSVFLLAGSCRQHAPLPSETGLASYYSDHFEGRLTASGEKFSNSDYTAAHRTLPFGTRVRVTNLDNDRTVVVRISDRGPFVKGRVLDLSRAAAADLGFLEDGVISVRLEVLPGD